jgi:hypothetical protein
MRASRSISFVKKARKMLKQLSLFPDDSPPDVPEPIERLLAQGAALAISISGGKDGQAMLKPASSPTLRA